MTCGTRNRVFTHAQIKFPLVWPKVSMRTLIHDIGKWEKNMRAHVNLHLGGKQRIFKNRRLCQKARRMSSNVDNVPKKVI